MADKQNENYKKYLDPVGAHEDNLAGLGMPLPHTTQHTDITPDEEDGQPGESAQSAEGDVSGLATSMQKLNAKPKIVTCYEWTEGRCFKSEEDCTKKHYFFPDIIYRSVINGTKVIDCKFDEQCNWPNDVCGYAHTGDGASNEIKNSDPVLRTGNQRWEAVMKYRCKYEGCGEERLMIENIERHCRGDHEPLELQGPIPQTVRETHQTSRPTQP